ncbi:MAG TPA: hypothetical protein VGA50_04735 [Kiloniellales bacterium]
MKAISLWQPWASLLGRGVKHYETRSWPYPPALQGEQIAIHAAKRRIFSEEVAAISDIWWDIEKVLGPEAAERIAEITGEDGGHLPRGAIVGLGHLTQCVRTEAIVEALDPIERALGNYAPGRYAWHFTDLMLLGSPLPVRGRQGFFDVEIPVVG